MNKIKLLQKINLDDYYTTKQVKAMLNLVPSAFRNLQTKGYFKQFQPFDGFGIPRRDNYILGRDLRSEIERLGKDSK